MEAEFQIFSRGPVDGRICCRTFWPMSLVVRHRDTGCYLQGHDLWTPELDGAMRFNSGLRLVDYVEHGGVHTGLEQIEVIVIPPSRAIENRISENTFEI